MRQVLAGVAARYARDVFLRAAAHHRSAAVAAFVWLSAAEGSLVKQIAYNAMLTASISTASR